MCLAGLPGRCSGRYCWPCACGCRRKRGVRVCECGWVRVCGGGWWLCNVSFKLRAAVRPRLRHTQLGNRVREKWGQLTCSYVRRPCLTSARLLHPCTRDRDAAAQLTAEHCRQQSSTQRCKPKAYLSQEKHLPRAASPPLRTAGLNVGLTAFASASPLPQHASRRH